MPNPIVPGSSPDAAPRNSQQQSAMPPHTPATPETAGGRELATVLPAWDLVPPSNVIAFRRGPR